MCVPGHGAPICTLAFFAIAVFAQQWSALAECMSFDRAGIVAGEYWRLLTGHFTHWNNDHLTWDVLMFVLLGSLIERRSRACLGLVVYPSAAVISAAIWFAQPGIQRYRGLSGVDSALFAFAALMLYDEIDVGRQKLPRKLLALLAAAFALKVLWEIATGATLFVDSSAAGFTPLPLAHAVGGCVGVAVWWATRRSGLDIRPHSTDGHFVDYPAMVDS